MPHIAFYSHFIIAGQNEHSQRPRSGHQIFLYFFVPKTKSRIFLNYFSPEMGPQMKIMKSLERNSV